MHKQSVLSSLEEVPVLVLDCNNEFEDNQDQLQQHVESVRQFMKIINDSQNTNNTSIISPL
jgi:hypothetical protein